MFDLSELDKLKKTRDKRAIPVVALYLDENNEYTGKYEVFESRMETYRTTGVHSSVISHIINQSNDSYTSTHRNGNKVTFVNAYATEEEVNKHLKRVKEVEYGTYPVAVRIIYLDENNKPTGEYEIFTSETEASKFTGVNSGSISNIINQKQYHHITTHRNGNKVTFVNASATEEEVDKHLKRVKKIEYDTYPVAVVMIYLDENNEYTGKYESFESRMEASNTTGVNSGSISNIINQKNNHYTTMHRNSQRITFVNANATQEEINEHIQKITNR